MENAAQEALNIHATDEFRKLFESHGRSAEVKIGDYTYSTSATLGQGSFGLVKRLNIMGPDNVLKTFAIKKATSSYSSAGTNSLLKELEGSPFILKSYGATPGGEFEIFELADATLEPGFASGAYHKDTPGSQESRAYLFHNIFDAMTALHGRNWENGSFSLVHRDLKPENMMLVNRGGDKRQLVIIDLDGLRPPSKETTPGSLAYMSPEQTRNFLLRSKNAPESKLAIIGPESDIFALGIMLLEAKYARGRRHTNTNQEIIRECCDPEFTFPQSGDSKLDLVNANASIIYLELAKKIAKLKGTSDPLVEIEREELKLIASMIHPTRDERFSLDTARSAWHRVSKKPVGSVPLFGSQNLGGT
jgi:serine/threonine protein kinase